METTTNPEAKMTEKQIDTLMDEAQAALVKGQSRNEIISLIAAHGVSTVDAEKIVSDTETHPITKIMVGMNR